jgi:general secretion pathway protein E
MSRPEPLDQWSQDRFIAELSDFLTDQGVIDANGLERARALAGESGARLDAVLTQLGLVSERTLAESMGKLLGLDVAGSADYPDQAILPERLRLKFLRKSRAVPLSINNNSLIVAMADPLDHFTVSSIAVAANRHVHVRVAVPIDLEAALERLYRPEEGTVPAEDAVPQSAHVEDDAERLKDLASEAPLIRLVNLLISQAVESRASDIHIDPFEDRLRIRYRFDGVLHEVDAPPRRLHSAIVSRIKIMSSLDIAERRLPQDGRIKLVVRGQEVDLRVSTIPSLHGESVVLRILDRSAVTLDFAQLGIEPALQAQFCHQIEKPNGIVLVTGPTGSGKTTTLYTALLHLNTAERNIITVEDPIEYQLSGITQIQTKPQIGLNFAAMLRSILRHDPDVIMVGEIRDLETAQIAVQAALTGHLVLSTLHTNSAAATIARLRDMGVEDYLLTATLNGIMAQRLLRRLCPACRRPVAVTAGLAERYGLGRNALDGGEVIYEAGGCPKCRDTGYRGRIAVAELIVPDDTIHDLILSRASHAAIQDAAARSGMTTMYENGLRQVLAGTTSLSEVLRSVRMED